MGGFTKGAWVNKKRYSSLHSGKFNYGILESKIELAYHWFFFHVYEFQTFTNSVFSSWFVLEKCKKNENALNLMPMLSTIEFKDNNEDFITTFKKIVLEKI